jgi:ubiquinone/menaquinone biosynthesis C-methylase UbiE
MRILEIGVGTGKSLGQIYTTIQPGGIAVGIDLSQKMLALSAKRSSSTVCQADARKLPFTSNCFERVFISYVLDLVSISDIPGILVGVRRVLKTGGRIVVVAMTEGVDTASRTLVSVWKAAYSVSPITCAGCRPLRLTNMLESAGFKDVQREVVVQMALPSEILLATK